MKNHGPQPSAPKGNRKFQILLIKIFKNKKQIRYFQLI